MAFGKLVERFLKDMPPQTDAYAAFHQETPRLIDKSDAIVHEAFPRAMQSLWASVYGAKADIDRTSA